MNIQVKRELEVVVGLGEGFYFDLGVTACLHYEVNDRRGTGRKTERHQCE